MKILSSAYYRHTLIHAFKTNDILATGLCNSASWNDLNVDENYTHWDAAYAKYSAIAAVVTAAHAGQSEDSVATLLHWAARCNKTWPISQFLQDTEHCDVMALDASGRTALDWANAAGSTAAAEMLQAHITKNKLKPKTPALLSSSQLVAQAFSDRQKEQLHLATAKAALAEKQYLAEAEAAEQKIRALEAKEAARLNAEQATALAAKHAAQAETARLETEKQSQLKAEDSTRQSFSTLPLAELIRACGETKPNAHIAHAVLLKKFTGLKKLDLANTQLTLADVECVMSVLENSGQLSLQHINLAQNTFGDEGLIALLPLLHACGGSLQTLNLSGNQLSDTSAFGLIKKIIPKLTELLSLDLMGNVLGEDASSSLRNICKEKQVSLKIDAAAPISSFPSASLSSLSSPRSNSSSENPWGTQQRFFPEPSLPSPDEIERLRGELDRHSVWGGTTYTSQTTRYLDFKSTVPQDIAETLRSCILAECMQGTEIEVHNLISKKQLSITLSTSPGEQSKNTALIKTLGQLLKRPNEVLGNTITLPWSELKARHVNLCMHIFSAYHQTVASFEGLGLTAAQMEAGLTKFGETLMVKMTAIEGKVDTGILLQLPPSPSLLP